MRGMALKPADRFALRYGDFRVLWLSACSPAPGTRARRWCWAGCCWTGPTRPSSSALGVALRALPNFLLGIPGGALADRVDRRLLIARRRPGERPSITATMGLLQLARLLGVALILAVHVPRRLHARRWARRRAELRLRHRRAGAGGQRHGADVAGASGSAPSAARSASACCWSKLGAGEAYLALARSASASAPSCCCGRAPAASRRRSPRPPVCRACASSSARSAPTAAGVAGAC